MDEQDKKAFDTVKKLFKDDRGEPFEMTPGQISLFRAIYEKQNPRIQFECYTQYGKSDIVSMAVLLRATTFPEQWVILGGTQDKARIIMEKIIKHIFENRYTISKFEIGKEESLERIRRERNKDKINFKIDEQGNLGGVYILSADARKKGYDAGDILIGHGAPNLVEDDAALIPDSIHGKAVRMLGGHTENFLLKITNSFGRNHAYDSLIDPKYKSIVIPYGQGIEEGRIKQEFIDEMRGILDPIMFSILYECKHPPADLVDESGWMQLISEELLLEAQQRKVESMGYKHLGCDIGEGGNFNAFVVRTDNVARFRSKDQEKDLMKTAENIVDIYRDERIPDGNVAIDGIGIGAGVVARVRQLQINCSEVKSGEKPTEKTEKEKQMDPIEFSNLKAEMCWKAAMWMRQGGALEPSLEWNQLMRVMYKEDAGKRIKIMTKEEMRAKGLLGLGESTDVPDAFFLTFAPKKQIKKFGEASGAVVPYYPDLNI